MDVDCTLFANFVPFIFQLQQENSNIARFEMPENGRDFIVCYLTGVCITNAHIF